MRAILIDLLTKNTNRTAMAGRGIGPGPLNVIIIGTNCVSSKGQYITLTGVASGGYGNYSYNWSKQGIASQTITYPINSCPVTFKLDVTSPSNTNSLIQYASATKKVYYSGVGCTCPPDDNPLKSLPENSEIPKSFRLDQNYPNPFNPSTNIRFSIPENIQVTLDIYNMLGQKIRTLVNGELEAATYDVQWDGTNENGASVSSGIYLYRITTSKFVETKKMILVR